jgi:hypothetical protein
VLTAGGRFAPGHLGELTQVPFEIVDAVLEETCRVHRRVRDCPSRVVVYLLLAGCLFAEQGYSQVWQRLEVGLGTMRCCQSCGRPGRGAPICRLCPYQQLCRWSRARRTERPVRATLSARCGLIAA